MLLHGADSHIDFEKYCNIAQNMAYGLKSYSDEVRTFRGKESGFEKR